MLSYRLDTAFLFPFLGPGWDALSSVLPKRLPKASRVAREILPMVSRFPEHGTSLDCIHTAVPHTLSVPLRT